MPKNNNKILLKWARKVTSYRRHRQPPSSSLSQAGWRRRQQQLSPPASFFGGKRRTELKLKFGKLRKPVLKVQKTQLRSRNSAKIRGCGERKIGQTESSQKSRAYFYPAPIFVIRTLFGAWKRLETTENDWKHILPNLT